MHRLENGFPIGSVCHAWGTTIATFHMETGHRSTHSNGPTIIACSEALGIGTLCAELTAPRPDRPVTQLCYQLAPITGDPLPDPDVFAQPLTKLLGRARESSTYELPSDGDPSGSVRFYANWDAGDFSVGLSLYGAPRQTQFGPAYGCLWLSWAPAKAAQPYLAEWRARTKELAAREPLDIAGFSFGAAQMPVFGFGGSKANSARREADNVLYHPELLPTPRSIAALTSDHGATFWRFGNANWCASTAWDTLVLTTGEPIDISWNDVAPAKGGGFSEIAIERWAVRDWHGSPAVRDAVAYIERMSGQRVNHVTGYDC
jgi:hypothetical protein